MHPVLLKIGPITIYSYGLMLALGFLIALFGLLREAPNFNIREDYIFESVILTIIGSIIGARLGYVLIEWPKFSVEPWLIFDIRSGGLAFHGGFFGAILILILYCRYRSLSFLKLADFFAPYLALGYAFGRIGCFLNGCCYGEITSVPWAVTFAAVDSALRHPTQLYASLAGVISFILLRYLRKFHFFDGYLMSMFFLLYGIYRYINEFFRAESVMWGENSAGQLISLAMIFSALGVLLTMYLLKRGDK
ncbi:MAG: prolipoprotein diacylglyceryl transferase [Firmicutes bacterium]|nr:prolipoprotein diacylglyceryl transferase [Bacillota bacterium]